MPCRPELSWLLSIFSLLSPIAMLPRQCALVSPQLIAVHICSCNAARRAAACHCIYTCIKIWSAGLAHSTHAQ